MCIKVVKQQKSFILNPKERLFRIGMSKRAILLICICFYVTAEYLLGKQCLNAFVTS